MIDVQDIIKAAKAKADIVNAALRDTRYQRAALQVQVSELATTEREIVGAINRAMKAQDDKVAPAPAAPAPAAPAPAAPAKARAPRNPAKDAIAAADLLSVVG